MPEPFQMADYGFAGRFEAYAAEYPDYLPARVVAQHRDSCRLVTPKGEYTGRLSGKYRYDAHSSTDFPTVGDFVVVAPADSENAVIHALLPRSSLFLRKEAGGENAQLIAANVDTVFITMALNNDFNLRRLERYLSVAWDSMARPVIVLTKADLCDDLAAKLQEVESVALGVDIIPTAALEDDYAGLLPYIAPGRTVTFTGSSGVGKSTLINRLMGRDAIATQAVREDGKGRHTTTHRELFLLPGGGLVIDTPGMRELGIDSADIDRTFSDIDELAGQCRFADCRHESEPGCAVQAAIAAGDLTEERLASYQKLMREAGYEGMNSRQREEAKVESMFGSKNNMKQFRDYFKDKNRQKGRG